MSQEEFERNQEMWKLRHIDGWSLSVIGKKYNVSRERVRQIIGNTGKFFRSEWTRKMKASGRFHPQHLSEIKSLPGVQRVWEEGWGNERHIARESFLRQHQEFEDYAQQILIENGIDCEVKPSRHPYSIETENGARVDVKIGHELSQYPSQHIVYPTYRVPNVCVYNEFDFLMAFIPEGVGYTYFVIPYSAVAHISKNTRANLRIPWPCLSGYKSKWHQYHKRIDLIKEFQHESEI